jgi:hypothetical protein
MSTAILVEETLGVGEALEASVNAIDQCHKPDDALPTLKAQGHHNLLPK